MSWDVPEKHEALHELNGVIIAGLKRCRKCGLSETYWSRWPDCEGCRAVNAADGNDAK